MTSNTNSNTATFPTNWLIDADYDPTKHFMSLRGTKYLNVQQRMIWFLRDQRHFIEQRLATHSYIIRTELVEHDQANGWAHFKTYVRDVFGNEATMYGSESKKDFADYLEKASTKSLGRALLALGYGTAFADEMDEGERVVDTPVERKRPVAAAAAAAGPVAKVSPATKTAVEPQGKVPDDMPHKTKDGVTYNTLADLRRALEQYRQVLNNDTPERKKRDDAMGWTDALAQREAYVQVWRDTRAELERAKAAEAEAEATETTTEHDLSTLNPGAKPN